MTRHARALSVLRTLWWEGDGVGLVSPMLAVRLARAAPATFRLRGEGIEIEGGTTSLRSSHDALMAAGLAGRRRYEEVDVHVDGRPTDLSVDRSLAITLGVATRSVALTVHDDMGRHLVARRDPGVEDGGLLDVPFSGVVTGATSAWEQLVLEARQGMEVEVGDLGRADETMTVRHVGALRGPDGVHAGLVRDLASWWGVRIPSGSPTPRRSRSVASLAWADPDQILRSLSEAPSGWRPAGRITMLAAIAKDSRIRAVLSRELAGEIVDALRI